MTVRELLLEGKDIHLLEGLGWFLLAVGALIVLIHLLHVQVPYGKHSSDVGLLSTLLLSNVKVPAKVGWFLQELPSLVIPLYLILNVGGEHVGEVNPNIILLGMFILHYFNR